MTCSKTIENNSSICPIDQAGNVDWFMPFSRVEFESKYVKTHITDRNVHKLIHSMSKMLGCPMELRVIAFAIDMMRSNDVNIIQKSAMQTFLLGLTRLQFEDVTLTDQILLGPQFFQYISKFCPNIKTVDLGSFILTQAFFKELMKLDQLEEIILQNVDLDFTPKFKKVNRDDLALTYYIDLERDIDRLKTILSLVDFNFVRIKSRDVALKFKTFEAL